MKNQLAAFAEPRPARVLDVVYKGVKHELGATPNGETYFAILYPDPAEALRACSHNATVNNRIIGNEVQAYPLGIYSDVLAIHHTYRTPAGQESLDISVVFGIYDHDPALFGILRGLALVALGMADDPNPNSGKASWDALFLSAKSLEKALREDKLDEAKALAKTIRQASKRALRDFTLEGAQSDGTDDPDDVDPLVEALASGNAPTALAPQ